MKNKSLKKKLFNGEKKSKSIQTLITSFFKKKIYGYDFLEGTWHCCECGIDMGKNNPRQYCGKYECDNRRYLK